MGTWGAALYSDDVALDVKDGYLGHLRTGKSPEETLEIMVKEYETDLGDSDGCTFWAVIGQIQWSYGHLNESVRDKALTALHSPEILSRWEGAEEKLLKAHVQVLNNLEKQLRSPMPPPKKVRQLRGKKCPWQIGDLISVRLAEEDGSRPFADQRRPFLGGYMLLQVVAMSRTYLTSYSRDIYDVFPILVAFDWWSMVPPTPEVAQDKNMLNLWFPRAQWINEYILFGTRAPNKKEREQFDIKRIAEGEPITSAMVRALEQHGFEEATDGNWVIEKCACVESAWDGINESLANGLMVQEHDVRLDRLPEPGESYTLQVSPKAGEKGTVFLNGIQLI